VTVPESVAREALLRALPAPASAPFEDWDGVLDRAEVARARKTTRRALVIALALLTVAVLAVPAVGVGSRLVGLFWENGAPVDPATLGDLDSWLLDDQLGADARIRQIASDGSIAYYVMVNGKGESCLAYGRVGDRVRFSSSACGPGDVRSRLPSVEDPIHVDLGGFMHATGGAFHVVSAIGLCADGIARVALVGPDDTELASASVTDHVFQLRPSQPIKDSPLQLVAYDDDGAEVHREALR
jgi:hypothetical protein